MGLDPGSQFSKPHFFGFRSLDILKSHGIRIQNPRDLYNQELRFIFVGYGIPSHNYLYSNTLFEISVL